MADAFEMVEAMRQKAAAREAERVRLVADRAADNRKAMPQVTAWVDSTREVFGDVRVVYASEAGRTIGAKGPDGVKLSETLVGPWNRKKDEKKR